MNELLKKAQIPDNHSMYIGKFIQEPYLVDIFGPHYALHVRPTWPYPAGVRYGEGEIVLASGERIQVFVIGLEQVTPHPEAVESGFWTPADAFFSIRPTDLHPEQIGQVRYFVQPVPPAKTTVSD